MRFFDGKVGSRERERSREGSVMGMGFSQGQMGLGRSALFMDHLEAGKGMGIEMG